MSTKIHEIQSLSEMRELARAIAMRPWRQLLLLLDGDMGAGKTRFTSFFVEALAGDGDTSTSSPSFAIHNSYKVGGTCVDHLDLFRLESREDLESTGFWDLLGGRGNPNERRAVLIEWAERLDEFGESGSLPSDWTRLSLEFEITGGEHRRVTETAR